jgi:DNA-binding HxlR family transcriptional regulator
MKPEDDARPVSCVTQLNISKVTSMQRPSFADVECSVAQSLEVIGEWWSLMVVREIFFGRHRFEEMHEDLGIARNTLTNRLNRLVDEGVLERRTYSESGRRAEYHLTQAGRDLHHVIIALLEWGNRWRPLAGGPATVLIHSCGHETTPVLACEHCHEEIRTQDLRMAPGPSHVDDENHPLVRSAAQRALAATTK